MQQNFAITCLVCNDCHSAPSPAGSSTSHHVDLTMRQNWTTSMLIIPQLFLAPTSCLSASLRDPSTREPSLLGACQCPISQLSGLPRRVVFPSMFSTSPNSKVFSIWRHFVHHGWGGGGCQWPLGARGAAAYPPPQQRATGRPC